MFYRFLLTAIMLFYGYAVMAAHETATKVVSLDSVRTLIGQNRSLIIENLSRQIARDNLQQSKSERLPELLLGGDGYWSNSVPLKSQAASSNSFIYKFNLGTEFDLYSGGKYKYANEEKRKSVQYSEERYRAVEEEIELEAFVMLYDIFRNIKYREFLQKSIDLRQKEYERIKLLYENGYVLKSDLLRSKLYITDLQKDEVNIKNSILILSDKLRVLLGMETPCLLQPDLEESLDFKITRSFEELLDHALMESPHIKMRKIQSERESAVLKGIKSERIPHFKLYANYGVGTPLGVCDFDHQLGGEVGLKMSFSISSFYKSHHASKSQQHRIIQSEIETDDMADKLRNRIHELYVRYNESLLNIDRAKEKVNLSKESTRILRNSYFNQQSLLIDVLESETKAMEAAFEWVQAVVDSQKYYWALQKICGY